jgi:cytochrome bd ubiquinol oxidase subunit II
METAWFCLLAVMVTMYVVLDGFDLGVGALHLLLSRNEQEREEATAAIGPVWNGNEVWLLASGGVLFMAFPKAYAGAFSGLYFGLIIVLWLLVGRGLGLEFRHQIDNPLWRGACDAVFSLSSAALALVFGVALGNVVRGVPLGADGYFSLWQAGRGVSRASGDFLQTNGFSGPRVVMRFPGFHRQITGVWAPNGHPEGA